MKNKSKENKNVADNFENTTTETEEDILLEKIIGIKNFDTTKVNNLLIKEQISCRHGSLWSI